MDRREAISKVALLMGGTMISMEYMLTGCKSAPAANINVLFEKNNIKFLDEVGDTILPATQTPGAKEVQIGSFMAMMVRDCYVAGDQQIFINGISKLDDKCKQQYNKGFLSCNKAQRTELLNALNHELYEYKKIHRVYDPAHYFRMMKELTLLGYFTSEDGCTKAMRYDPVPGRFDGCIPYKKGDKAWATS